MPALLVSPLDTLFDYSRAAVAQPLLLVGDVPGTCGSVEETLASFEAGLALSRLAGELPGEAATGQAAQFAAATVTGLRVLAHSLGEACDIEGVLRLLRAALLHPHAEGRQ